MFKFYSQYLTNNACFIAGRTIKPTGIVVHSTGANNPNLRRYLPGDDLIGYNEYNNDWDTPYPDGESKCVHAFIGKDKNGNVQVYKTLPWNYRCWGCGSGRNGSYNDSRIQFEICEQTGDYEYWQNAKNAAVKLCAYLVILYGIPIKNITDHQGAYQEGYASNHSDVGHWWDAYGYDMNDFRKEVEKEVNEMDYETFKSFMTRWIDEQSATGVSDYAKEAWEAGKKSGVTDGSAPHMFATREQTVTLIDRAFKNGGV